MNQIIRFIIEQTIQKEKNETKEESIKMKDEVTDEKKSAEDKKKEIYNNFIDTINQTIQGEKEKKIEEFKQNLSKKYTNFFQHKKGGKKIFENFDDEIKKDMQEFDRLLEEEDEGNPNLIDKEKKTEPIYPIINTNKEEEITEKTKEQMKTLYNNLNAQIEKISASDFENDETVKKEIIKIKNWLSENYNHVTNEFGDFFINIDDFEIKYNEHKINLSNIYNKLLENKTNKKKFGLVEKDLQSIEKNLEKLIEEKKDSKDENLKTEEKNEKVMIKIADGKIKTEVDNIIQTEDNKGKVSKEKSEMKELYDELITKINEVNGKIKNDEQIEDKIKEIREWISNNYDISNINIKKPSVNFLNFKKKIGDYTENLDDLFGKIKKNRIEKRRSIEKFYNESEDRIDELKTLYNKLTTADDKKKNEIKEHIKNSKKVLEEALKKLDSNLKERKYDVELFKKENDDISKSLEYIEKKLNELLKKQENLKDEPQKTEEKSEKSTKITEENKTHTEEEKKGMKVLYKKLKDRVKGLEEIYKAVKIDNIDLEDKLKEGNNLLESYEKSENKDKDNFKTKFEEKFENLKKFETEMAAEVKKKNQKS